MSNQALRHHHARKQIKRGWPLIDSRAAHLLDKLAYPIGVASLLMSSPQIYDIFVNQQVAGLTFITWFMWSLFNLFWIFYGIVHKVKAILFLNMGWFIVNGIVAFGILLYS
jgi:hypothetical protein